MSAPTAAPAASTKVSGDSMLGAGVFLLILAILKEADQNDKLVIIAIALIAWYYMFS